MVRLDPADIQDEFVWNASLQQVMVSGYYLAGEQYFLVNSPATHLGSMRLKDGRSTFASDSEEDPSAERKTP